MWLFEGATSSTAEISLRNSQFQHIIRSTSPFLFAFLETKKFRTIIVRIKQINLSLINQKAGNCFFSCSVLKWVFLWKKTRPNLSKLNYSILDVINCSFGNWIIFIAAIYFWVVYTQNNLASITGNRSNPRHEKKKKNLWAYCWR